MNTIGKGLDFHQTFKPERTCMTSLLTSLHECSGKNIQEISRITGIPTGNSSGKVAPTISYLEYMGLIDDTTTNKAHELSYTRLGECVLAEDPGFMEILTLLLIHCMICRRVKGAELWSSIICNILPKYNGSIKKSYMEKELQMYFGKDVNRAPFNGCYGGLLDQAGVIDISDNEYLIREHTFNPEFIYLYGYILLEYWDIWADGFSEEEQDQNKISYIEITADQIKETGFRFPFGWSEKSEYQILEALHEKNIISMNRQMSPFAVRRIYSKEELLNLLYSELC